MTFVRHIVLSPYRLAWKAILGNSLSVMRSGPLSRKRRYRYLFDRSLGRRAYFFACELFPRKLDNTFSTAVIPPPRATTKAVVCWKTSRCA
jgi:hypothetical protein